MKDEGSFISEERLDAMLRDARDSYRVPAEPPLDAMWARVEHETFDAPRIEVPGRGRTVRRWFGPVIAAAATLAIGFGLGRFTQATDRPDQVAQVVDSTDTRRPADPLVRATEVYLEDAQALLVSLPSDAKSMDTSFVRQAQTLLTTTRLFLDSPVGADPRLRDVLEDLELVLAQVVRLKATPRAEELTFIAEAVNERDVVPRIRTVAAAISNSDF